MRRTISTLWNTICRHAKIYLSWKAEKVFLPRVHLHILYSLAWLSPFCWTWTNIPTIFSYFWTRYAVSVSHLILKPSDLFEWFLGLDNHLNVTIFPTETIKKQLCDSNFIDLIFSFMNKHHLSADYEGLVRQSGLFIAQLLVSGIRNTIHVYSSNTA